MSITKYRVNLSVSPSLKQTLTKLAKRDHTSVATKAVDLVRIALEIDEDATLLKLAEERGKKKGRYLSHDTAWI